MPLHDEVTPWAAIAAFWVFIFISTSFHQIHGERSMKILCDYMEPTFEV